MVLVTDRPELSLGDVVGTLWQDYLFCWLDFLFPMLLLHGGILAILGSAACIGIGEYRYRRRNPARTSLETGKYPHAPSLW